MKHYERSKSSLFLMELLINLLLFCVLCGCGLMFFIKSTNMTERTTDLHNAVRITSSVASIYESTGDLNALSEIYPNGSVSEDSATLYFDEEYQPCPMEESIYTLYVTQKNASMKKATIALYNQKEECIYSIDAFYYKPSTLENVKEVPKP